VRLANGTQSQNGNRYARTCRAISKKKKSSNLGLSKI